MAKINWILSNVKEINENKDADPSINSECGDYTLEYTQGDYIPMYKGKVISCTQVFPQWEHAAKICENHKQGEKQ